MSSAELEEFWGKRMSLFAYSSGPASTLFTIKVQGDTTENFEFNPGGAVLAVHRRIEASEASLLIEDIGRRPENI